MDSINEAHVSEPVLVVVDDVAAADDATALVFQQLLADRLATATADHTTETRTSWAYGCAANSLPSTVVASGEVAAVFEP
ncbi:DUF6207 family protein [Streptomyces sp. NPDC093516]|uniref:DUF6207 family protein n=1 Tax=Streptomyces sp. NPDC093516 TaxID=3155304 RepID=UPI003437B2F4